MGCNKTLHQPKCIVRALSRKPQQQQSYSRASHSTASHCADSLRIGAQATHMKLVVSEDKACQASKYAAQMQIAALVQEQHACSSTAAVLALAPPVALGVHPWGQCPSHTLVARQRRFLSSQADFSVRNFNSVRGLAWRPREGLLKQPCLSRRRAIWSFV